MIRIVETDNEKIREHTLDRVWLKRMLDSFDRRYGLTGTPAANGFEKYPGTKMQSVQMNCTCPASNPRPENEKVLMTIEIDGDDFTALRDAILGMCTYD